MKTPKLVFFVPAFLIPVYFGLSQDAPIADSRESVPAPSTAHIIGNIPDGTPPPPERPKPKFIVPAQDILESNTYAQGGRQIIVRKITPIALPPPPLAAPPVDITSPAIQARIASLRAKHPTRQLILIGANVFRSKNSPVRSLVHVWPNGGGEPVKFWSSADFGYLSGFGSFLGSDGETRSLMMAWSVIDTDRLTDLMAKHGREYHAPVSAELPSGKAAFSIVGDQAADSKIIVSIQSLHDIYNNEFLRLKTAYEGRELANRQREAELKANPPLPRDIILNHWHIDPVSTETTGKGGAR